MKKTWKQLLGTVASPAMWGNLASRVMGGKLTRRAALSALALSTVGTGPVLGQHETDGVVVLGNSARQTVAAPISTPAEEGSVQLGGGLNLSPAPSAYPSVPSSGGPGYQDQSGYGVSSRSGPLSHTSGATTSPETIYPAGTTGGNYPSDPYTSYGATGNTIGYAVTQDPEDVLFRIGRRNRDIYGVDEGFTTLGAYLTRSEDSNRLWFLNPRMILTDQGRGGLNLGFGQKAYVPDLNRVFSLSAWWDFDSGHESDYHQIGVSFEMIGQNFSIRSNANFVVSRNEHEFGAMDIGDQRLLSDGSVVQDQVVFTEVAYDQADLEFAMPMPLAGKYGWEWAGGVYWLTGGDGRDATGVKGRVESQVTEDLWVNMLITNDRVFDTNVSVNLELTLPGAPPSRWWRRPNVRDHLWTSVRRYYRVATTVVEDRQIAPVMGLNGDPMRLALIDPNVTDNPLEAFGGTGSLDDPFKSVADYMDEALVVQEQFSIIAVRSRTDDTDLNLNTTIVLLDGQALLGEGVPHSLDGLGLTLIAPPFASMGVPRPRLTNSDAPGVDVVTLANGNQVAGFVIDAGGGGVPGGTASGIVGDGITGFSINQVDISNAIDGIRIRNIGDSVGIITGLSGTGNPNHIDNTITGIGLGSTRGISIEHEGGTLQLLVRNNTVSNFQGEDANTNGALDLSEDINMNGVLDPGEDIDFDGILDLSEDLNMNGILDRGFGIRIAASGGSVILADDPLSMTLPLGILNNTLNTNGTGLSISASDASFISANVENNLANGSTDLGEDANRNGLLDPGEDINMNGALDFGSGINVFSEGGSTINLITFLNNSATGGAGNGATFQTFDAGAINIVNPNVDPDTLLPALAFGNNVFTGNALDGMFVRADTGSIIFDQIDSSIFNNNGDDGLDMETDNAGTIFVRDPLLGNEFSGNGDNGLEVTSGVGGGVDLMIGDPMAANPNLITGNGTNAVPDTGAGIFLGTIGGVLDVTFAGLTSTLNSGSGAMIFLDGGMINIPGGITNNEFINNGEHGLAIINNNGGMLITPFVSDNDFSNNEQASLFIGGSGPGNGLGTTGLTDLGSVTRNSFNRDTGFTLDPMSVPNANAGILFDASDQRIIMTLTQNTFVGRLPSGNDPGAGFGIGGTIGGSTTVPVPGGLTLQVGTVVPEDINTFLNNGDAHIGLTLRGNTINSFDVQNGVFNEAFDVVGTSAFLGEGIHIILQDIATLTGQITESEFLNNQSDGILIEMQGNNDLGNGPLFGAASLNSFEITSNLIQNNGFDTTGNLIGSANGIEISRTERGQFNDLFIADNFISGNSLNGIMISSVGANQLNLPNMRADTVAIIANDILDNFEDGIEFVVGADADMAARVDSNLITGNGVGGVRGNGIEARERIQDSKDSRSITGLWTSNVITDNFDDGIDLSAYMGNPLTELTEAGVYTVAPLMPMEEFPTLGRPRTWGLVIGTAINDLNGNGILDMGEDVALNPIGVVDLNNRNFLQRNGGDGVDITGGGALTVANNIITDNGTPDLVNGDSFNGFIGRHAGINIDAPELNAGISTFLNPQTPRPLPNDEFNPDLDAYRDVFIFSNLISLNNGDGIEFLSQSSLDAADSASSGGVGGLAIETRLMIAQNEITLNQFRGIDILQRPGDSDPEDRDQEDPDGVPGTIISGFVSADVSIIGNHVKGNQWEGIYVVQTVDDVQNQISPAEVTIDGNGDTISMGETLRAQGNQGDIDDVVRLRLDIHDNQVIGNGDGIIDFPSSGLVVRVGTSGGTPVVAGYPAPIFDPNIGILNAANYFATGGTNMEDVNLDGLLDNDLDGDGFLDAAAVSGSGVSASVTGNTFDGNFGDDFLFHSFTATVDPATTNGTWDDMMFVVMQFQADPLSRLDLIFSLNQFNSAQPNNNERGVGTSPGNAAANAGPDAGAYYDNAEPEFKSRESMQMPGGPFSNNGGVRQRNATRFASRYITGIPLPPLAPAIPDLGIFKYPGMGNSTFRVRGDGNFYTDQGLGAVTLPQIFIFDDPAILGDPELIDATFEAMGVFMQPGGGFGELPWGWDVLEPGTPPLPPTF